MTMAKAAGSPANDQVLGEKLEEQTGPAGASQALLEDAEGRQDTGPGEPPPLDAVEAYRELLLGGLEAWNLVAGPRAPVWVFRPEESQALAGAWAPVCAKHLPDVEAPIELVAVLVSLPILLPRISQSRASSSAAPPGEPEDDPANTVYD